MEMSRSELIARIQCDFGVNGVHVRPVGNGWAILHQLDMYHAETLFSAKTKAECDEIIREAARR